MQAAVEFHHRILGFFWGQWKNYGLSLGISSVLGRAGGQVGQGLSIRIFVYVKILTCRNIKACGRVGSVGHGEREPARQRQNHSGEHGAAAAATRGGQ